MVKIFFTFIFISFIFINCGVGAIISSERLTVVGNAVPDIKKNEKLKKACVAGEYKEKKESSIDPDSILSGLDSTLGEYGLHEMNKENAKYVINMTLEDWSQNSVYDDNMSIIMLKVNYQVIEQSSKKIIFNKSIVSTHTTKVQTEWKTLLSFDPEEVKVQPNEDHNKVTGFAKHNKARGVDKQQAVLFALEGTIRKNFVKFLKEFNNELK